MYVHVFKYIMHLFYCDLCILQLEVKLHLKHPRSAACFNYFRLSEFVLSSGQTSLVIPQH